MVSICLGIYGQEFASVCVADKKGGFGVCVGDFLCYACKCCIYMPVAFMEVSDSRSLIYTDISSIFELSVSSVQSLSCVRLFAMP